MSRQLPNSVLGATQPNLRELTTFRSFTRHFIPGGIAAFLIFAFFLLFDIFEYPFATAGGGIEWIAAALMPLFSFVSLGSLFGALCWLSRISEAQTRERAWQRRKTLRNSVFPSEPETDFERADDLPPPPFDSRLRRYKDHISNEKSAANSSDANPGSNLALIAQRKKSPFKRPLWVSPKLIISRTPPRSPMFFQRLLRRIQRHLRK